MPADVAEDWRGGALCAQTDPNLWHPPPGGNPAPAKLICAQCPVTAECLDHAVKHDESGVWGGKTAAERRQLRAARPRLETPQRHQLRGRQIPDLAVRMRLWRYTHNLTQQQAADRYGITKHMCANYETGRHTPRPDVRAHIDTIIRGTP